MPVEIATRILLKCSFEDALSVAKVIGTIVLSLPFLTSSTQTCKKLHEMVMESRNHWLYRLRGLGRACAPVMPPNVKTRDLTTDELRAVVIKAIQRNRKFFADGGWMEDPSKYCPKYDREEFGWSRDNLPGSENDKALFLSLLPGGKYLFSRYKRWRYPRNLEYWHLSARGPVCVWSYHSQFGSTDDVDAFAHHANSDGSIDVLLSLRYRYDIFRHPLRYDISQHYFKG